MKKIILVSMMILALFSGSQAQQKKGKKATPAKKPTVVRYSYPSDGLSGFTIVDLNARYLGIKSGTKVGKTIKTNFKENLVFMFNCKDKKCEDGSVAQNVKDDILARYDQKKSTKMTFAQYTAYVGKIVTNTKTQIAWSTVGSSMDLNAEELALAKSICMSFGGKDIVSYAMTELLPSANGKLNKAMFNFLLTSAGKEYLECIPAMYDGKTSFGPFQFTEYALYDTPREKRGASIINTALPLSARIPGSVMHLKGDDHYKAAYLFAVYNVCRLVKRLDKKELASLKTHWKKNKDDVFVYCAIAHHLPAKGIKAARLWLKHDAKYTIDKSCNKALSLYAKKTRKNLAVI